MGRDIMYLISKVDQSIRDCSLCNVLVFFSSEFCIFTFYILYYILCILFFVALCAIQKLFLHGKLCSVKYNL